MEGYAPEQCSTFTKFFTVNHSLHWGLNKCGNILSAEEVGSRIFWGSFIGQTIGPEREDSAEAPLLRAMTSESIASPGWLVTHRSLLPTPEFE